MKIAIDARCISSEYPTGIEKTILRLLENLSSSRHTIILFTNKKIPHSFSNYKIITSRIKNDGIWFHLTLPFLLALKGIDWFISPITQLPKILPSKVKTCVFVYDLAYKYFSEEYPADTLKILLNKTDPSIRRSNQIITISASTKKDLETFFPDYKGKIDIVALAGDDITERQPINNPDIKPGSILMVGTGYGRKNFQILGPVLLLLKTKYRITPKVLIIGQTSRALEKILSDLPADLRAQITHLGYVSDSQKNWLLSQSSVLFFPSLYEGFGIPVLEAMKAHCPVVCSNTSSLPEIVGQGAITVNPKSAEECAAGLAKILTDSSFRRELIAKGDSRVNEFSWSKSAHIFADILKKLS